MKKLFIIYVVLSSLLMISCEKEPENAYKEINLYTRISCHGGESPDGETYTIPYDWSYIIADPKIGALMLCFDEDDLEFWQQPLKISIEPLDEKRIFLYDIKAGLTDYITNVPPAENDSRYYFQVKDSQNYPFPWVKERYYIELQIYIPKPDDVTVKTNRFRLVMEDLDTGMKYHSPVYQSVISDIIYQFEYPDKTRESEGYWFDLVTESAAH